MSNIINLIRTKFETIESGEIDFGYRLFDDYDAKYGVITTSKKAFDKYNNDGELLRRVNDSGDENISEMLNCASEHGMVIDNNFYEADWVKKELGIESDN